MHYLLLQTFCFLKMDLKKPTFRIFWVILILKRIIEFYFKVNWNWIVCYNSESNRMHNVSLLVNLHTSCFSVKGDQDHNKLGTQNTFRGVKHILSLCALGTQAPLGAGFGNPFASAVGTSLGSSTLGGIASAFLKKKKFPFCPSLKQFNISLHAS